MQVSPAAERYLGSVGSTAKLVRDVGLRSDGERGHGIETSDVTFVQVCFNAVFAPVSDEC
jgi:hypothetical protein